MKLISKETEYTFSFTEKELKVLMAAFGSSSPLEVQQKLREPAFIEKFNTAYYTDEDYRKIYMLWDMFCEALEVTP